MEADHRIILTLCIFLSVTVFLQICSLEYFHFGYNNDLSANDFILKSKSLSSLKPLHNNIPQNKDNPQTQKDLPPQLNDGSLMPLEDILKRAGVEVTDEIRDQLPPKEDVISMYGSEPVIVGLDQCKIFQNTVDLSGAFIGPAGMFNTGTNLLETLLSNNCYIPARIPKHGKESIGMRFQVPWGKHSPVSWRYKHSAPAMVNLNQTSFLAAVVIKDPYTWMNSMCRHSYAANWRHVDGHCPNLVAISEKEKEIIKIFNDNSNDKADEGKGEETFKVNIHYRDTNITHHDSLADLWNTWYGDWINADFPRLIVRFEDLLFHTETVVRKVCECGGGEIRDVNNFKYSVSSAKTGKAHKGSNGLVKSMTTYSDTIKRLKSFTVQDLDYAVTTLRSDIMTMFKYAIPNRSH